ncbi:hypothetical protein Gotur_032966, partial [Gossypium turneri]
MNNRGRYPPVLGRGRGANANPSFQSRPEQPHSQDWKARLKMPPSDTRYKTE